MAGCGTISNQAIIDLLFVIAPQFYTTDPVKLAGYNALINSLECLINCQLLGCCALLAFANLLAHFLTMQLNPYLGVQTNIAEGQLSIGFADTASKNFYDSSAYGQAYWSIIKKFKIGALVTNMGARWYGPACCGGGYGSWV